MARIRRYLGRVEVHLNRTERAALLHAIEDLAAHAETSDDERLRPRGYDDPALAEEFRRLMRPDLDSVREADIGVLRTDLGAGRDVTRLDEDRALAWLRALNHLRLSAASRLGIVDDGWEDEADADRLASDDAGMLGDLGWVQQGIIEALDRA